MFVDGESYVMTRSWGTDPANAGYTSEIQSRDYGFGCHEYFVQYETADGRVGTFPEEGSYQYGDACDNPIMWTDSQDGWADLNERTSQELSEDIDLKGCASTPARAWLGLAAFGALGAALRRRSTR